MSQSKTNKYQATVQISEEFFEAIVLLLCIILIEWYLLNIFTLHLNLKDTEFSGLSILEGQLQVYKGKLVKWMGSLVWVETIIPVGSG